ncbi:MAG TPA: hypothetical protein VGB37_14795 [Candidatus Lokiarchaeia archaeon]
MKKYKYEFKKGDKVRRIYSNLKDINVGDTAVVLKDCLTDNGEEWLNMRVDKNGIEDNYFIKNFKKIEEKIEENKDEKVSDIEIYKKIKIQTFAKEYIIADPTYCMGILPIIPRENNEKLKEIETSFGKFYLIENPKMTKIIKFSEKTEIINIEGTNYNYQFIQKMRRMASEWYSDVPDLLMKKENGLTKKDDVLMLIFGNKLCFILAPRVNDDR